MRGLTADTDGYQVPFSDDLLDGEAAIGKNTQQSWHSTDHRVPAVFRVRSIVIDKIGRDDPLSHIA